jgi:hypothetical protein
MAEQALMDSPSTAPSERIFDLKKALELRLKGLTYEQIGVALNADRPYCAQAVHYQLQQFERFTGASEALPAYESNRVGLLNAVEWKLMASCMDEDKLAKASLNNVAYALTQVSTLRRLESGQSTSNVNVLSRIVSQSDQDLFKK